MRGDRLRQAFALARAVHSTQRRRGSEVPYLAHLLGVSSNVLNDGGTEDQAIAALLHDAVEDHPEDISFRDIEKKFGRRVAAIVEACTEPPAETKKPRSWLDEKRIYVAHILKAPEDARRVILADKLDNARYVEYCLSRWGKQYWKRFESPTEKEMTAYHRTLVESLAAWKPSVLYEEFKETASRLGRRPDA